MPVPMSNTVVMFLFDLLIAFQLTVQFWHATHKALIINKIGVFGEKSETKNPFDLKGSIIAF